MRRFSVVTITAVLALSACGGGSDDTADTVASTATEPPAETAAAVDTESPAETEAPTETEAPVDTEPPADTDTPADGAVAVSLVEWAVEAPVDLAAGPITFEVTNDGDFPHHFAIARGNSYEDLPQIVGAVDETALGDDYLGRTENIQSGATASIEFDLEPGNYVLFCNIATTVSHAAQGQVLSVTVS
jgi:hypothetical protein